jgi:chromosome partitioning protein
MRTTVMEGEFGEFDLASVMQVVSIGRQYTGIELFDEAGNVVGTLFLKSGKILAASSGSISGLDAVTSMIRGGRSKRFSVYRAEPFNDVASPVGSVGEILLKLMESEPPPAAQRTPVMQGDLVEFDLLSVLQVISIGRQFTAVELSDTQGRRLGTIELKSGKVLSATSDHLTGMDAIRRLARCPRETRFIVYRSRDAIAEHHLGPLAQILMRLADPDEQWDLVEPNTRSRVAAPEGAPTQTKLDGKKADAAIAKNESGPPRPEAAPAAKYEGTRAPKGDGAPGPDGDARRASKPPSLAPRATANGSTAKEPALDVKREPAEGRAATFLEPQTNVGGMGVVGQAATNVPVIAVTSPKGGTGKTTVSLNLGVAFARQGKRVMLVDADANGVLLALNAAAKGATGAYDVIAGKAQLAHVAIKTRVPGLRIVPSGDPAWSVGTTANGWTRLLAKARAEADIVLVDTAAGLYGVSGEVCAASSHSLVVLAAEPTSLRALPQHLHRLAGLGHPPPNVVGVVLNMLDYRAPVSLETLRELCAGPSAPWVFDVPIARSGAFMESVARGVPVCRRDRAGTPTIGWVFEMLASGILERLGLLTPAFDDALLD